MPARKPVFEPTMLSNCVLWLRADQGVSRDEANSVLRWNDASGAGNHGTQTTNAARPLYVTSAQGLRPTLRGDGVADRIALAGISVLARFSVFMVVSKSTVASSYLWSSSNSAAGFLSNFTSVSYEWINGADRYTFSAGATGMHVLSATHVDGTSLKMWFDGAQVQSVVPTVAMSGRSITRVGCAGNDSSFAASDIQELIVYTHASVSLSNNEVSLVNQYLGNRYKIVMPS